MASSKLTAPAKPTEGDDAALVCPWCTQAFRPRRRGSTGRFCCASHRTSFWTACRKLGEQAVTRGEVTVADLKADPAACTLRWSEKAPPPCPEIGSPPQPSPEPLKRFIVEVPQGLLTALFFRHHEIRYSEMGDLAAVLAALARLRHQPKVTEDSNGAKVLSF
jgi:hypothetical protein